MLFNNLVIFTIYNYLDINNLVTCSLINKQFNKIFDNDLLWKKLLTDKYGNSYIDVNYIMVKYNVSKLKHIYKIIKDLLYFDTKFNVLKFHIKCDLNKKIKALINLEYLTLVDGYLQEIPYTGVTALPLGKEIQYLTNLRELYLSTNMLNKIPKEIGCLTNLQILHLSNNQLQEIPEGIKYLINLKDLYLSHNKIQEISPDVKYLTNLQNLYLSHNKIQEIPTEIQYLTNLQNLSLSYNKIQKIPTEIQYLTNLQNLFLSYNRIQEIPTEIQYLTNLKHLYLSHNKFTKKHIKCESLINCVIIT